MRIGMELTRTNQVTPLLIFNCDDSGPRITFFDLDCSTRWSQGDRDAKVMMQHETRYRLEVSVVSPGFGMKHAEGTQSIDVIHFSSYCTRSNALIMDLIADRCPNIP